MVKTVASIGLKRIPKTQAKNVRDATRNMREQFKVLNDNLARALQHIEDVTAESLEEAMMPIFKESQQLVPKDTLRLMKSGFLSVGTFRGQPAVNIGYGLGNKPPYAIVVHEDMHAAHKDGTQAKFLEQPYKQQLQSIPSRVSRIIKRNAGT